VTSYPPFAKLLAVEPGGPDKEAERLAQFAEYLASGNEWFTPGPRLMAHIRGLHDAAQLIALVAARWVRLLEPQQ
jgi:hypothetical protein